MRRAFTNFCESWMCRFVPPLPKSAEYLAELSGVVGLSSPQVPAPVPGADVGPFCRAATTK
jgi:hypothetical protein